MVALNRVMPRSHTADNKSPNCPEFYPIENVNKGVKLLGHVKRPKIPCMRRMVSRDDTMYFSTESPAKDSQKELRKFKRLFGSIIHQLNKLV